MSTPPPTKINLGSGKDFKPDFLNIDISDYWSPDIVCDVSADFPSGGRQTFQTRRFGEIEVAHGAFDEIVCNDVLEHVPDLVRTVTNCLNLLKVGGLFNVIVPYDLSYGAWQDPTHVRAFNERSWLYYTDWFWYLGWFEHRFEIADFKWLDAQVKPCAKEQAAFMKLTLRKIATTVRERTVARTMRPDFGGIDSDEIPDDLPVDAVLPADAEATH